MAFLWETAVGKGQNFLLPRNDLSIIYVTWVCNRAIGKFPATDQSKTDQMSWINEKRLTCKSRKTLVRRVSETCVGQWQYLPEMLTCPCQKIDKGICFISKIPNPVKGKAEKSGEAKCRIGVRYLSYFCNLLLKPC